MDQNQVNTPSSTADDANIGQEVPDMGQGNSDNMGAGVPLKASHHGTGRRRALPITQNFMAGKIRERRRQLKLTQAKLAERLGVSHSLVSHWEQAKTRVMADDLEPLAAALETSRAYLVGGPSVVEFYQTATDEYKARFNAQIIPVSTMIEELENLARTTSSRVRIAGSDLIDLRDRHEQVLLDGFRALTDRQREIVLSLVADLSTLPKLP